ncbi:hypothetical protein ABT255_53500 [Streptomyces mirabilis]|uniref:hypothetical protein n=1 Tax=Streptomyces mirabilis TaxID=68239 RepID=UPI003321D5FB
MDDVDRDLIALRHTKHHLGPGRREFATVARSGRPRAGRRRGACSHPANAPVGRNASPPAVTGYAGGLELKWFLLDLEEPAEEKAARLF